MLHSCSFHILNVGVTVHAASPKRRACSERLRLGLCNSVTSHRVCAGPKAVSAEASEQRTVLWACCTGV